MFHWKIFLSLSATQITEKFLFSLNVVCDAIEILKHEHEEFTDRVLEEQAAKGSTALDKEVIDNYVKELNHRAKRHKEAIDHRDAILAESNSAKLLETFLEAAPQTVLQLYIMLQTENQGDISSFAKFNMAKSFVVFFLGVMSKYLGPTQVSCYCFSVTPLSLKNADRCYFGKDLELIKF